MISIKLKDKIIKRHIDYLLHSDIEEDLKSFKNTSLIEIEYHKLHNEFCDCIIEQIKSLGRITKEQYCDNIFTQTPDELSESINKYRKKYGTLFELFKNNEAYSSEMLKHMGYQKFSSSSMRVDRYKNELEFFQALTQKCIRSRLKTIKGVNRRYLQTHYSMFIQEVITNSKDFIDRNSKNRISYFLDKFTIYLRKIDVSKIKNVTEFIKKFDYVRKAYMKLVNSCIIEDVTNISNYQSNGEWSAYDYVMELGLKTCPYCNRSYITPIYSEKGKMRADLDHFFAKSLYPFLSMSIYNLVPACKLCNSSFKGDKEFTLEKNISPFENDIKDLYKFTYYPRSYDSFFGKDEIDIGIEYNISVDYINDIIRMKENNKVFNIENTYFYHKNIVRELLIKRMVHSNVYVQYLYDNFQSLFASKEDVLASIVGRKISSDDYDDPLAKLKNDIIQELDF